MPDLAAALDDLRSGRFDSAEAHLRRVLEAEPNQADALDLLAIACSQRGRPREAIEFAGRAIAARPRDARLHFNRAMIHERLGDAEAAIADYRDACRLDSENLAARINLGHLLLRDDRLEEAEPLLEEAAALQPNSPEAQEAFGVLLQRRKRGAESVAALRRALALAPGHPRISANLGWALLEAGEADQAAEQLRNAVAIDPGVADYWANLGAALMRGRHWREALPQVERALALAPAHTRALALKAIIFDEIGKPDARRELVDLDAYLWQRRFDRPPPGYADMKAFNEALVRHVSAHPSLMAERSGKTTRKGSQTGELLTPDGGPILALADMFRVAIGEYLARVPGDRGIFARERRPRAWRLRIWANVLDAEGYKESHHHPSGWISGVYYPQVPAEIRADEANKSGWLEVGRPDPFFRSTVTPELRIVRPEEGLVVLFPSYVWHRTIPFVSSETRVSIAFDAVPTA